MALNLRNLFGKKTYTNQQEEVNAINSPSGVIKGVTNTGDVIVASNVNWKQKGVEDAGISKGDINAFHAGFTSAFAMIKKSQALDEVLQNQMKKNLENQIIGLEEQKAKNETQLGTLSSKLSGLNSEINGKNKEIADVNDGKVNADRTIIANLYIGICILVLMTIYLFIFYSSTAFSAFFRNFDAEDSVYTAMFYGKAISESFKEGLFEGLFIIFLPTIFMGLGFVIHQFTVNSKGFSKYIKSISLYVLTFVFDFLLAYKISKAIYDTEAIYRNLPPFSLKIAFADMDFWIVIFCGFVSYIIWGLVFSFVMQCYDRKTSSKHLLKKLQGDLNKLQTQQVDTQNQVNQLKNLITSIVAQINQKKQDLKDTVRYDFTSMLQYLANYYQGWISYFNLFGGNTDELSKAHDEEMNAVNDWMNKK